MIRHLRNVTNLVLADPLPQRSNDLLADRHDIVLVHEAHLDVKLSEFRLSIGSKIFVAIAPCNLEILFHARDHE